MRRHAGAPPVTAMKVTEWERRHASSSAGLVVDEAGDLLVDAPLVAVIVLQVRATTGKGSKNAMMSERSCLRKIFDCMAALSEQSQLEAVTTLGSQVANKSYEETADILAAWFAVLVDRFPSLSPLHSSPRLARKI